jgi:hypothetical protein
MVSKKNMSVAAASAQSILYFLIVILAVSLLIVSTLLYYAYSNKKEGVVVEKNVKASLCPQCPQCPPCQSSCPCPKAESAIPVYPKELPTYDNSREYQQVGILTSNDDTEPIILPLFSKRANNHRDRWNYYTTTDKNTMLRLPISHDNMKCDDDIGCNEIYDGNTLYIEMYRGKTFKATIYKKQTPSYFADKY